MAVPVKPRSIGTEEVGVGFPLTSVLVAPILSTEAGKGTAKESDDGEELLITELMERVCSRTTPPELAVADSGSKKAAMVPPATAELATSMVEYSIFEKVADEIILDAATQLMEEIASRVASHDRAGALNS